MPITLNKNDFAIVKGPQFSSGQAITYRGIPILSTVSQSLEDYEFYLLNETETGRGTVALVCRDDLGDLCHIGEWYSMEEAWEWLKEGYKIELVKYTG